MARLLTSGFEWGEIGAEGFAVTVGTATFGTATVRSGAMSLTCAGTIRFTFTGATATGYWARIAINVDSSSFTANGILWFFDAGGVILSSMKMNTNGTVSLTYGGTNTSGQGTTTVSTSSVLSSGWHLVEVYSKIGSGSVDEVDGRIDGVSLGGATGLAISDNAPANVNVRGSGFSPFIVDDFALNDSTGSAQTSWCGTASTVLLVPASDNAKGTGWTNDAASTTNLFDAVNNEPPVGIADTTASTGLHQIRNATSNANVNYDANLTTYTAAGIGASDTINVLVPMVATGAPVTTSAKAGTYGISSNPVITNVSLGSAGTAGAFWSGVAAGTYPTGWKWSLGTTTYAPSVTLSTAPVARITQVTSSTRVAMVCAMGMYVDYTPAVVAHSLVAGTPQRALAHRHNTMDRW